MMLHYPWQIYWQRSSGQANSWGKTKISDKYRYEAVSDSHSYQFKGGSYTNAVIFNYSMLTPILKYVNIVIFNSKCHCNRDFDQWPIITCANELFSQKKLPKSTFWNLRVEDWVWTSFILSHKPVSLPLVFPFNNCSLVIHLILICKGYNSEGEINNLFVTVLNNYFLFNIAIVNIAWKSKHQIKIEQRKSLLWASKRSSIACREGTAFIVSNLCVISL